MRRRLCMIGWGLLRGGRGVGIEVSSARWAVEEGMHGVRTRLRRIGMILGKMMRPYRVVAGRRSDGRVKRIQ